MFVRIKKSGKYQYLQVVENSRYWGKVHQEVLGNMGRLDRLLKGDNMKSIIRSLRSIQKKFKASPGPMAKRNKAA